VVTASTILVNQAAVAAEVVDAAGRVVARARAALGVDPATEVTLVFADDVTLHRLNRDFRGIDRPTDVLSFAFDPADTPPGEAAYLGDVVISVERAAAVAARRGAPARDEVSLLAVHGLLHLLGYDDETDAGVSRMRAMEMALGVREADDE
jgi:probable rRNA maturation factor